MSPGLAAAATATASAGPRGAGPYGARRGRRRRGHGRPRAKGSRASPGAGGGERGGDRAAFAPWLRGTPSPGVGEVRGAPRERLRDGRALRCARLALGADGHDLRVGGWAAGVCRVEARRSPWTGCPRRERVDARQRRVPGSGGGPFLEGIGELECQVLVAGGVDSPRVVPVEGPGRSEGAVGVRSSGQVPAAMGEMFFFFFLLYCHGNGRGSACLYPGCLVIV